MNRAPVGRVGDPRSRGAALAALALVLSTPATPARADPPELRSWYLSRTGITGYQGQEADVQRIRYSADYVYVDASGIPDYTIGPWPGNPNQATDQNYLFKVPRHPVENTGAKTPTPLGKIGAWRNGVVVFNARDAFSYNDQGVWNRNAVVVEGPSFDACLGHPAMQGNYHHHQNPRCLYQADRRRPSPLLGYAWDGYPIYGPYAARNPDGTGAVVRIRSSYRLRAITERTTLPDGTALPPSEYGPPVSATYPLGTYIEDYEYVSGLGDLDEHNGRFEVTRDYPAGTYAYHATIQQDGASAYPYAVGPTYFGVVATENVGPNRPTIDEPVTEYLPDAPGRVPPTVMVDRASGDRLRLSWNPSCLAAGTSDYAVYEGLLRDPGLHAALACSDDARDLEEVLAPSLGDTYYLVVPLGPDAEGSYGTDSSGAERPPGSGTICIVAQTPGGCD